MYKIIEPNNLDHVPDNPEYSHQNADLLIQNIQPKASNSTTILSDNYQSFNKTLHNTTNRLLLVSPVCQNLEMPNISSQSHQAAGFK